MSTRDFRLDPHQALRRALAATFGGVVTGLSERPWSSATFEGRLHRLRIAAPARPDRAAMIGDLEFPLPGHFVAEIALAGPTSAEEPDLIVEALTVALD